MVAAIGLGLIALLRDRSSEPIVRQTAQWLAWSTAPMLLGLASAPAARDRQDGIEAMVVVRGGRLGDLALGRALAAMIGATLRMVVPALLFAIGAAAIAAAPPRHAVVLVIFSCFAGSILGAVASLCGEAAGARGRELLMILVFVPWVLADVVSAPLWSLPGLLDAGLAVALA